MSLKDATGPEGPREAGAQEPIDEGIRRNRMNVRYSVVISGEQYSFPPVCTCCLRPTGRRERVTHSSTTASGNTETVRTVNAELPLCDECARHRQRPPARLAAAGFYALGIGALVMAVLRLLTPLHDLIGSVCGLAAFGGCYLWFSLTMKVEPLGPEHSAYDGSVGIVPWNKPSPHSTGLSLYQAPQTTFTFSNWQYAALFKAANEGRAEDIEETFESNTAASAHAFGAADHPMAPLPILFGIFAVIAVVLSLFTG